MNEHAAAKSSLTALVELRQYTLHTGARDTLIDLFDRELVETQEACGMSVIGQFRDLERPDRFVWLRGFDNPQGRTAALEAFYGGPDWLAHRDAANATMIDFDDVLLLRPAAAASGFALDPRERPQRGEVPPSGLFEAIICPVAPERLETFSALFHQHGAASGTKPLASFVTDTSPNGFPRLPVRDVSAFVWFSRLAGDRGFTGLPPALAELAANEPQVLRLAPTARSLLR